MRRVVVFAPGGRGGRVQKAAAVRRCLQVRRNDFFGPRQAALRVDDPALPKRFRAVGVFFFVRPAFHPVPVRKPDQVCRPAFMVQPGRRIGRPDVLVNIVAA